MRNQWRQLLLLRCYRSSAQVNLPPLRRFQVPSVSYSLPQSFRSIDYRFYGSQSLRYFPSERDLMPQDFQKDLIILKDVFSTNELKNVKIKHELEANTVSVLSGDSEVVLSDDLVVAALRNLRSAPDVAWRLFRLFSWFSENTYHDLHPELYFLMGDILLENSMVQEFLALYKEFSALCKKADEKPTSFGRTEWRFTVDLNVCDSVCRVIKGESWSDDVEKQLRKFEYSSDLVSMIAVKLGIEDDKGLMFFKWIEESGLFKHDQHTFNAMLEVLAREDSSERFRKMAERMKKCGFKMEKGTWHKVCTRVCGVIGRESWREYVEKQLREMNVEYLSDLVSMVVRQLGIEDDKGLMFFKWIEEGGLFKHDQHTFNAMLEVLAREDSSERFRKMAEKMKKCGFEMEEGTWHKVWVCGVTGRESWREYVEKQLREMNVGYLSGLVSKVVRQLGIEDDKGLMFFKWIEEGEKHDIYTFHAMLRVLAKEDSSERFFKMAEEMKKSGFEMEKGTYLKERTYDIAKKLFCARVCGVIERESWSDDVEKQLSEMDGEYSVVGFNGDLVSMVVRQLGIKDNKGLMFFKWIGESGLFKHDEYTFHVMLEVLAKENSSERFWKVAEEKSNERFWKVAEEMKKSGFEMNLYMRGVAERLFLQKKTIYDGVNFLEFAMGGVNKLSVEDCTSLLMDSLKPTKTLRPKKNMLTPIPDNELKLNVELFSLFVRIYKELGIVITDSMFETLLKHLRHKGRLGEINKILNALEVDGGFVPRVASHLTRPEKSGEEMVSNTDWFPGVIIWESLLIAFCVCGDVEKASSTLQEMAKKFTKSECMGALEGVVTFIYWSTGCPSVDMFMFLVLKNDVCRPSPSTFRTLFNILWCHGEFWEILDTFIKYLSESGTPDDAVTFLDMMTASHKFSLEDLRQFFLGLFEAYFKLGKNDFARDLLLKCPKNVRNTDAVFKILISKLLAQGEFREALYVLPLMKTKGCNGPTLSLFIEYLSQSGSLDDATALFDTAYELPLSTSFFLRLFKAYMKLGKNDLARDLLLRCPEDVRNDAAVLKLFSSKKSGKKASVL